MVERDAFEREHMATDGAAIETIDLKDWRVMEYDHRTVFNINKLIRKSQTSQTVSADSVSSTSSNTTSTTDSKQASVDRPPESSSSSNNSDVMRSVASEEVVTEFIEQRLKQRTTETSTQGITFHIWDCGGQEVYYNTHHFFFTSKAIYLLVVDLSLDDFETTGMERVEFWIRTIRSYAPQQVVIPPVLALSFIDIVSCNRAHNQQ